MRQLSTPYSTVLSKPDASSDSSSFKPYGSYDQSPPKIDCSYAHPISPLRALIPSVYRDRDTAIYTSIPCPSQQSSVLAISKQLVARDFPLFSPDVDPVS